MGEPQCVIHPEANSLPAVNLWNYIHYVHSKYNGGIEIV